MRIESGGDRRRPVIRVPVLPPIVKKTAKELELELVRNKKKIARMSRGMVVVDVTTDDVGIISKVDMQKLKVYCWWGKTYETCVRRRDKNPKGLSYESGNNEKWRTRWLPVSSVNVIK